MEWLERVQIFRSLALAEHQSQALEERLQHAIIQLMQLTPAPARGKRQFRDETDLQTAIGQVLERQAVKGFLNIRYQREEHDKTRLVGRGRPGPKRVIQTVSEVRYVITQVERDEEAIAQHKYRLGWRNHVTNLPVAHMSLPQTVQHYRGGWALENDFHLLKDKPLGISPLFVRLDEQIVGLTRLLTLALRILTLIQVKVRHSLTQVGEELAGLYEGQANRTTIQPTSRRLLKAVANQEMTLTLVVIGVQKMWHLTPLTDLLTKILHLLDLPPSVYTRLVNHFP